MKNRPGLFLFFSFFVLVLVATTTSCKKTTLPYTGSRPGDYYMPLQVGKYAIYRLDSLTFYFYGQLDTTTSYLAKDTVEKAITDASGQPAWLVTRYLSDLTGAVWTANESYVVNTSTQRVEVTENNLRFIKLAFPIDEGLSWQGNNYLPYDPYQDFFVFGSLDNLQENTWNYTYQHVDQPYKVGANSYDSTVTILQIADSSNVPIVIDTAFASNTYWTETYAKHIGLVYRHTSMWEYQPPTPNGNQNGYKIGFELTMQLMSHN